MEPKDGRPPVEPQRITIPGGRTAEVRVLPDGSLHLQGDPEALAYVRMRFRDAVSRHSEAESSTEPDPPVMSDPVAGHPARKPPEPMNAAPPVRLPTRQMRRAAERKALKKQRSAASDAPGTAKLRYLRISPQKARLVANVVRGLFVAEAIETLSFLDKKAAEIIKKLIESAVANAEQKYGNLDIDELFVDTICVDGGPTLRRFRPRAQGRANRILKSTSHITVELGVADAVQLAAAAK